MEYTLIRSSRRTLSAQITREAKLVIRAPERLPKEEIESFLHSRLEWIDKHLAVQRQRIEEHPEPTEAEREEFIKRAKQEMPRRVAYWSSIMSVVPTGVKITSARSRFGSCSGKNSLCFSWRLMQYPNQAIDYVVVHELAHIIHKNHSSAFYALVGSVLPDWQERRALLRR